jgi:hypothetical protein
MRLQRELPLKTLQPGSDKSRGGCIGWNHRGDSFVEPALLQPS